MLQFGGEGAQDYKIREAVDIGHPTALLSPTVVLESNVLERFQKLGRTIIQPVRMAHKRDDHVPPRRLVQDPLGMTRDHHLALLFPGCIADHVVDLVLAQNFHVRVRFVEEQN